MKRSRQFFFLFILIFSVCAYTAAPRSAYAEETPSGDNTDGGSISLDIVHYQAQSLTLQLNSDHLAYQDVTFNCEDSATGKPITISLLASPGTSEYTLYDLETPAEELTGTLNISMITEPGYQLNLENASFIVNGQTYGNGSVVTINTPSASVNSSVSCQQWEAEIPETPGETESLTQPQNPETSEIKTSAQTEPATEPQTSAESDTPAQSETSAEPNTPVQTEPTETTSAEKHPSAGASVLQTEPLKSSVPEVLTTTPITDSTTAEADIGTAAITPDSVSANTTTGSAVAKADTPPTVTDPESATDTILSSAARTTEENTGVHISDIIRRGKLVVAVLILIILILLLTKLILMLKRETRKTKYHHSR